MADSIHADKRRCQNRHSQRRFRERHKKNKTSNSWSISSTNQVGTPITNNSSAPLLSGSSSVSPDHTTSYIPSEGQYHNQGWLSSRSLSPTTHNEWICAEVIPTPNHHRDVLYRQAQRQHFTNSTTAHIQQTNIPSSTTQFSIDELSMPNTSMNRDSSYHQLPDFGPIMQASGSNCRDGILSPVSLPDADLRINTDLQPLRLTRPEEMEIPRPQRHVRTSVSRAEQMISEVENLYEFGVNLSIFPEDPLLCNSLRKMKERFRSLVKTDFPRGQRRTVKDMDEGSSQDSNSEE